MGTQTKTTQLREQGIRYDKLKGRGGKFLVIPVDRGSVFSREQFTEEHLMFKEAVQDFGRNRIAPVHKELNTLNESLTRELFREMGELGFLSTDFPEKFGGLGTDKVTAIIVSEHLMEGNNASIMVTFADHTGIGTLPIIWYGTEEQKQKYLPKLASGEWLGSFALTEPEAGSDALSGKTTATLSDDGKHYILNGTKIFVTNGSWSEVCVTFAKVDGDKFTAFILDKDCEGWVVGPEEKKMGIKGSSTCTYFFENCKVPVENVLGSVGRGSEVAFNVLYVGRYKLGATTMGGAKTAIRVAYEYAAERKQFDRSIKEFGMIRRKFADMIVRAWQCDTVLYMTAGSQDEALSSFDDMEAIYYKVLPKVIEDHGIEASICKIVGSEAAAENIDDAVQIFGGNGFIEEFPVAVAYRDERINRIFEGTNEINRLIIGGTLLKKAILEELPVRETIRNRELNWIPDLEIPEDDPMKQFAQAVELSRSLLFYTLNQAILSRGQDLKNDQWILEPLADMVISLGIMDSGFKRYRQMKDGDKKDMTAHVLKLSVQQQFDKTVGSARTILTCFDEEEGVHTRETVLKEKTGSFSLRFSAVRSQQALVMWLDKFKRYFLDD